MTPNDYNHSSVFGTLRQLCLVFAVRVVMLASRYPGQGNTLACNWHQCL